MNPMLAAYRAEMQGKLTRDYLDTQDRFTPRKAHELMLVREFTLQMRLGLSVSDFGVKEINALFVPSVIAKLELDESDTRMPPTEHLPYAVSRYAGLRDKALAATCGTRYTKICAKAAQLEFR